MILNSTYILFNTIFLKFRMKIDGAILLHNIRSVMYTIMYNIRSIMVTCGLVNDKKVNVFLLHLSHL